MHPQHFGDSYDIVKQSLLAWLSADLGPWSAYPMFTDKVDDERATAFARFLGVRLVTRERLSSTTDRTDYFRACKGEGHLFLDPDTGVKMKRPGKNPKYLYGEELADIARDRPSFLTMTFDQSLSRARKPEAQVKEKLNLLGLFGFAYVSHAAFIVLGCDPLLVERARETVLVRSQLPARRFVSARRQIG